MDEKTQNYESVLYTMIKGDMERLKQELTQAKEKIQKLNIFLSELKSSDKLSPDIQNTIESFQVDLLGAN